MIIMRRHHYRIVNPFRFFIFVLVCVMILAFAVSTVIGIADAQAASADTYAQVLVDENDTLWDIAEEYSDNKMDIRQYVRDICETNDIDINDPLQP